jgi:Mn-dependent DtxR family transcriptional regulator
MTNYQKALKFIEEKGEASTNEVMSYMRQPKSCCYTMLRELKLKGLVKVRKTKRETVVFDGMTARLPVAYWRLADGS